MDCDIAREALSARVDGEREPLPAARVDEHLRACEPCREWYAGAVAQTQVLRRLAGRTQVSAVRSAPPRQPERMRRVPGSWPRWALGIVGVVQLTLAVAQGMGAELGVPHAAESGHVLNESTAWSAALGVVMLAAAIRPAVAGGLACVLVAFTGFLLLYEITDVDADRVSFDRPLTHLPVVAAAALALLVWRRDRAQNPGPTRPAALSDDITLPDNASRGRRRSHLRSTDGSAA